MEASLPNIRWRRVPDIFCVSFGPEMLTKVSVFDVLGMRLNNKLSFSRITNVKYVCPETSRQKENLHKGATFFPQTGKFHLKAMSLQLCNKTCSNLMLIGSFIGI